MRQSPAAIDHEAHDKILKCQRADMILKCRHKMSNNEKNFRKKVYSFFHVFMISYIAVKLIGLLQKNKKQQRDDIISFFYNAFKVRVGVNAFLELDGTTLE